MKSTVESCDYPRISAATSIRTLSSLELVQPFVSAMDPLLLNTKEFVTFNSMVFEWIDTA